MLPGNAPLIIYVPGLLPKPEASHHKNALFRCLIAGVAGARQGNDSIDSGTVQIKIPMHAIEVERPRHDIEAASGRDDVIGNRCVAAVEVAAG